MKILSRRIILMGVVMIAFAALVAITSGSASASPPQGEVDRKLLQDSAPADYAHLELLAGMADFSNTPPPPDQDPCLSCHIAGEIIGEWVPISRWFIFGAVGLIFIFGITRNFSVWKTRELWQHRRMVHLGRLTAIFLIIQVITGIILFFFYKSTPEVIISIKSVIKAIHWGSGIILFITTLGLSFPGYLLPWYQRSFWAIIAITAIFGSSLAIANLSFAYLYADWHIPPSPSHLYAFHVLLLPVIIASVISVYIIILRKRGEIK